MSSAAVVMRISGGLGNQLFQYAFGRALAIRNAVPLVLDTVSGFTRDPYRRSYALGAFAIECPSLPESRPVAPVIERVRGRLARHGSAILPPSWRSCVVERDSARWDPAVAALRIQRRVYCVGYWQHQEYFADARAQLLADLRLRRPPSEACQRIADHMASHAAVAIHVRCLRHAPAGSSEQPRLGIDPSYYDRAIAHVVPQTRNPCFYVFSDDAAWARKNITCDHRCEHLSGFADYEDLWLMSRCQAFVIANSTFSWWGAWLATHPAKVVVAPRSGLGRGLASVPSSWQLL